uniref:Uncharacterized protein n=1 Tax=Arsenophonus nasoniae TaxID=638 RepID=D2U4H8_9GAMM|nr:hypothetical protein ARN_35960 [Arsenophonus nasoniae]
MLHNFINLIKVISNKLSKLIRYIANQKYLLLRYISVKNFFYKKIIIIRKKMKYIVDILVTRIINDLG